ncbi:MAG: LPS biosynthesis protein [Rickettsiales bacterium]|nr:LPS biosynthesis protein [Rickettsiales bacterium]|tara:strand:+ start:773 stop:1903 length:1131 start_codon:yes stop_codon:yes gene_type:complete
MKYCSKCLQPDTRPNISFKKGVCPACVYAEELKNVDWQERYDILENIVSGYRNKKKDGAFDCIIGVSGGKDSTRQALWIRDKLKLNPLLVCLSYPPEQVTNLGASNLSNLIELGFDVLVSYPSPGHWRKLLKEGFLKFSNWAKSTELALFSTVPQIAIAYKIPLIFWGENPGLQLGDLKTLGKSGYDGNNLRNMNTLSGGKPKWILKDIPSRELNPYFYPSEEQFKVNGLQIVYLGWFLGDWSLVNNALYSVTDGLNIRSDGVEKTGDLLGVSALDDDWVILNQMIKYYKFGFGKVSDYCNEEIRLGRLRKDEAKTLIEKYDHACDKKYIKSFCDYIEISVDEFWKHVRNSVNSKLFKVQKNGDIVPKFEVGVGLK